MVFFGFGWKFSQRLTSVKLKGDKTLNCNLMHSDYKILEFSDFFARFEKLVRYLKQ